MKNRQKITISYTFVLNNVSYIKRKKSIETFICSIFIRIHWLKQGSKEVFGTILEEQVYILIDASKSMKDKLEVLKQKLFQLLQVVDTYSEQF